MSLYLRKVFSSNMSHGTLVLTWLSSMHFHGAYFSNYSIWIKSPAVILPSSQSIWNSVGQDILNLDAGALDSSTGSIHLGVVAAHHFYLAVCLIVVGPAVRPTLLQFRSTSLLSGGNSRRILGADYPTVLCSFVHHIQIGSILTAGAVAHGSIHLVRDLFTARQSYTRTTTIAIVVAQRELVVGHLVWVTIFLGTHAFGLYVHNDTLQSLGRLEDLISDNGVLMKPILMNTIWSLRDEGSTQYIHVMDSRIVTSWQELGTSDFLVHHIHAFTIHVTLLILVKGVLTSRSSRLVSDKSTLGFRFPCDGPGRGGTCQISSWDHIFLSLFWSYNTAAVVVFHYYWRVQSDIWGVYDSSTMSIAHITGGDFGSTSMTINAWLTNFLWSQASQVIQSYGTSSAGYGLIFLTAHFIWALSLMFLYSGRGYWQELIESILWSHNKLHLSPQIQVRALSITQGRAVGLTHYLLGGVSTTWSFTLSRIVAVTT